jgi:hypothetical protein
VKIRENLRLLKHSYQHLVDHKGQMDKYKKIILKKKKKNKGIAFLQNHLAD